MKIFREKLSTVLKYVVIIMIIVAPLSSEAQSQKKKLTTIEAIEKAFLGWAGGQTYGNWFGPGWWGGNIHTPNPGSRAPVDSMDEIAMAHDFGYQVAEEQGAKYGNFEEYRLKGLADSIAAAQARNLTKWTYPPRDTDLAEENREIMYTFFEFESLAYDGLYASAFTNQILLGTWIGLIEYYRPGLN